MAVWIKDGITDVDFRPLEEVAFAVLSAKLSSYGEDNIWELIEDKLPHIADALRTDAAECRADGMPPRFEIDDEQSPYIKAFPAENVLLAKLRRIDPLVVEDLCVNILEKLGATANVTGQSGDGGVDFIGTNLDIMPSGYGIPAVCRATVIGQTKRYKETNVIKETALREFVGSGVWKRHKLRLDSGISPLAPVILAFWTTSNFEPNAKRYAREMGIWYMDGHTLASYIAKLGLSDFVHALPDENSRLVTAIL
ncbi:restriction endonuclease [Sphingobium terrigena]|nr:restriction endonuclease [Sphingobium terrigena]